MKLLKNFQKVHVKGLTPTRICLAIEVMGKTPESPCQTPYIYIRDVIDLENRLPIDCLIINSIFLLKIDFIDSRASKWHKPASCSSIPYKVMAL